MNVNLLNVYSKNLNSVLIAIEVTLIDVKSIYLINDALEKPYTKRNVYTKRIRLIELPNLKTATQNVFGEI